MTLCCWYGGCHSNWGLNCSLKHESIVFLYNNNQNCQDNKWQLALCCSISARKASSSSGRLPWKRKLCSASASHSSRIWTVEWNSSAFREKKNTGHVRLIDSVYLRQSNCWALQYLTQGLLQPGLFGHREVAHRLPAGAQLLHLDLDPGRVGVTAVDQLPGWTFEGLDGHCPLSQLFLKSLQRTKSDNMRPATHTHRTEVGLSKVSNCFKKLWEPSKCEEAVTLYSFFFQWRNRKRDG